MVYEIIPLFFTVETQVKPQNISRAKLSRYVFTAKMPWPKLSRYVFIDGKLSRCIVNRYLKKVATAFHRQSKYVSSARALPSVYESAKRVCHHAEQH